MLVVVLSKIKFYFCVLFVTLSKEYQKFFSLSLTKGIVYSFRLQMVFQNYKMNLNKMIDQFREFQFERRQSRIIKKMNNTFINVETQLGEHNQFFLATVVVAQGACIAICPNDVNYLEGRAVLPGENVETYDDRPDSVMINLIEGRGDDPLFIFATPDEKRRFVVAIRYFLNYSDPEGNNEQNQDQQNQDSDSGRASASSGNSGEI